MNIKQPILYSRYLKGLSLAGYGGNMNLVLHNLPLPAVLHFRTLQSSVRVFTSSQEDQGGRYLLGGVRWELGQWNEEGRLRVKGDD